MYFLAESVALGTRRRDATNARPEYVTTATSTYFLSISDPPVARAPTARQELIGERDDRRGHFT